MLSTRGRRAAIPTVLERAVVSGPDAITPSLATPAAAPAPAAPVNDGFAEQKASVAWPGQRLVRQADMRIQVDDASAAARQIDGIARAHAALVADSHITQADRAPTDARVVVRVPADSFDAVVDALRRVGRVRSENTNTGDVTRQYTDLETRLAVTEETAAQLRGLLANRTGKLSDVLAVERELSRVVTELEQMKAQRREYDREVAMSAVTVTLFEPASTGLSAFRLTLVDSLSQVTDVLVESFSLLVKLVAFVVPWAIVCTTGWWCVRLVRRTY